MCYMGKRGRITLSVSPLDAAVFLFQLFNKQTVSNRLDEGCMVTGWV